MTEGLEFALKYFNKAEGKRKRIEAHIAKSSLLLSLGKRDLKIHYTTLFTCGYVLNFL